MLERLSKEYQSWEELLESLGLDDEFKNFLAGINLRRENGILMTDTPDGRREVTFTTRNGNPVIGYIKGATREGIPIIACASIPNLPKEEISRGGLSDELHWGGVEELDQKSGKISSWSS